MGNSNLRKRLSAPSYVNLAVALAVTTFVVIERKQFLAAWAVAWAQPPVLAGGVVLAAAGIVLRSVQSVAAYRSVGVRASVLALIPVTSASFAATKAIKSGGAAGLVRHLRFAKSRGHEAIAVVAAYVSVRVDETISLCVAILATLLIGLATQTLTGGMLLAMSVASVYAMVVVGALGLAVWRHQSTMRVVNAIESIERLFRRRLKRIARADRAIVTAELTRAITWMRHEPVAALRLLLTSVGGKLLGLTTLAVVVYGFGAHLSVAQLLVAYVLSILTSHIGPLPGGLGATEASLAAILVGFGVQHELAMSITMSFRLFDFWAPLLFGFACNLLPSTPAVERELFQTVQPSKTTRQPGEKAGLPC